MIDMHAGRVPLPVARERSPEAVRLEECVYDFRLTGRITQRVRRLVSEGLAAGTLDPRAVASVLNLSPGTVADWGGEPFPNLRDPAILTWLAGRGLCGQALLAAEVLLRDRGKIVGFGALMKATSSDASNDRIISVMIHRIRKAMPAEVVTIKNVHGIGFIARVDGTPWEDAA